MFCTECGKEIPPGATFCPNCGRYLDPYQYTPGSTTTVTHTYQPQPPTVKRHSNGKVIAVIVVALLIAVSIFSFGDTEDEGALEGRSFYGHYDDQSIRDPNGYYAVYKESGFENGDADLFFTDFESEGVTYTHAVRLKLSEDISNTYSLFKYNVTGIGSVEKSEPYITFYKSIFGTYEISIECRNSAGDVPVTYDFSFEVKYWCPFEWKYDGGVFGFETYVSKTALNPYLPTESNISERAVKDYTLAADYVVVEDIITGVESELRSLYTQAYGSCTLGKAYADFILAYVQCGFTYASDITQYGMGEYFAYPLQTLAVRSGDCEDTSILCDAIFKAAGFSTALLLVPDHAMAGVALSDYPDDNEVDGYEVLSQMVSGKRYYACETTVDHFREVGLSDSNSHYSRYLDKGLAGYGSYTFYTVD